MATEIEYIMSSLQSLLDFTKVLVGGVFGLYVIILIVRLREYFMFKKQLKRINERLEKLESHFKIRETIKEGRMNKAFKAIGKKQRKYHEELLKSKL